jgi:YYY domain-containing protein
VARDIIIWWLVAQAFGLAGLPLTQFLLRALPDRGYAFSKIFGLLLSGYLAWLLAMLGLASFGRALVIVCMLAVGIAGLLITRKQGTRDAERGAGTPSQFSIFNRVPSGRFSIPGGWRLVLGYELLFAAALIFLALLRSHDYQTVGPNPWGTERPMDYALFNAIRRSPAFPPHDPWLSGYSINYYYFGYLLMACMALVSNLEQAVAYNLSLSLTFALTALGVAGVVLNLIALTDSRQGEEARGRGGERASPPHPLAPPLSSVVGRIAAALLSVILVLFAANQGGLLQVVTGTDMAVALEGRDLARAVVNGLGPRDPLYLTREFKGDYFDGTQVITPTSAALAAQNFNWWNSSRTVWDTFRDPNDPSQYSRRYVITEFPFFSFWLGDMHPHVMALPFGLLALALVLQTAARPSAPAFAMGRRGWAELALTGVVLGSLYLINSWDLPTYVLLFLGALLLLYVRLGTGHRLDIGDQRLEDEVSHLQSPISNVWWRHYATQAALALLAAGILFAPFYLTFRSLVGGKAPLINAPILATLTRTIGFVTWSKTPLHSFLIIFGLLLLPLVGYVVAQGRRLGDKETRRQGDKETVGFVSDPVSLSPSYLVTLSGSLPWITLVALIVGPLVGFSLLVLLPLALYAIVLALGSVDRPPAAFALWVFAFGCLICFGTEVVYIRDVFESRFNTIFKFYYQTWLLWGVLAGYAAWSLFSRRTMAQGDKEMAGKKDQPAPGLPVSRSPGLPSGRWSLLLGTVLFVALLAGALVYPWLTAGRAFRESTPAGLAGTTPRDRTPDGAAAIEWLRANAPGNAVILEAIGDDYDAQRGVGYGGVSASTGLSTVLGWIGHEQQWRGGDPAVLAQLEPRRADVETIYSTVDVELARSLLRKYGVSYIYVGTAEQMTYSPEGLAKLGQLGDVAFQQGDVTIYRVKQ